MYNRGNIYELIANVVIIGVSSFVLFCLFTYNENHVKYVLPTLVA